MPKNFKKIEKIVINVGLGRARNQSQFEDKILPEIIKELSFICGQKPAIRTAKKSIAGFKTRTGDVIGLQVTLRRKRMEDFFNKIINIILPRVKDFRGIPLKSIDGGGNLNIGFKEQFVFPEITAEKSNVNFGLEITIVPAIKKREAAVDFYRQSGIRLKK